MDPAIIIDHLSFAYAQTTVLSHVSLTIERGEFVGLIGPNGGGKTTLLKLIMGFLKPHQGNILLFGKSPLQQTAHPRLAYVPQSTRFDRDFPISVIEVVLSGLLSRLPWYGYFHRQDQQAAYAALERVGLHSFAHHSFGTLSGGQAQRVLIARALVSEPQLLILDEPTASVDSQAEADIYAILKELKGKMTILMVTHDLTAARQHIQRLFCVQGRVFALSPEELCKHFSMGLYQSPPPSLLKDREVR